MTTMSDADILAQVKTATGATDARIERRITNFCYSVRVAIPDGPTAFLLPLKLVDVEGPEIRLIGS